jgi:hypothetical protein
MFKYKTTGERINSQREVYVHVSIADVILWASKISGKIGSMLYELKAL